MVSPSSLRPELLHSVRPVGEFGATLEAHGLFNTIQFVLRLSPAVHRKLADSPSGVVTSAEIGFEKAQAFSTFLHETVHWWQHVGSTYGLMLSLSYPAQAHANYRRLKELLQRVGFKKPIRSLAATLEGPSTPTSLSGIANVITNNHFDFTTFRSMTFSEASLKAIVENPLFECVGHALQVTYGNNIGLISAVADRELHVLQDPRKWEAAFDELRQKEEPGFFYGSPVEVWPVGAQEILEGQACFCQLQYLAFGSGGNLGWDHFRDLGMLHGVYLKAFEQFLAMTQLEWPPSIDHPTVALFLLICDMAINPGAGFPHPIEYFHSFISDSDPGQRFTSLCTMMRLRCPHLAGAITRYSREEYEQVTEELSRTLLIDSPLAIAKTCSDWATGPMASLMEEHRTFQYGATNLPVRVMFSHFLAYMQDKLVRPEFFCWPGAWMAGERVSETAMELFDRHGALFVDKEDDDGIFPRLQEGRDQALVQEVFDSFYAVNLTYDLTDQWITREGAFTYDFGWLSQSGSRDDMKVFADRHFEQVYGVSPDEVEIL